MLWNRDCTSDEQPSDANILADAFDFLSNAAVLKSDPHRKL